MLISNFSGLELVAGTDEAGRGALAGPVVAGAVILPSNYFNAEIKDSKLLKPEIRKRLSEEIKSNAIAWGVGVLSNEYIDQHNILNAAIDAMIVALGKLNPQPEFIIVDGNRFHPYNNIPFQTIIKGDGKYQSIAAASILAKTFRDELMIQLHQEYPIYGWDKNKGYPTLTHRKIIQTEGQSPYHRCSFRLKEKVSS